MKILIPAIFLLGIFVIAWSGYEKGYTIGKAEDKKQKFNSDKFVVNGIKAF